MIYIPKYKEIYLKDGELPIRVRFKGEYRAFLYGCDGRLKYESGWKPNTILNQGFGYMCTNSYFQLFSGFALGDGGAVIDVTQTGLQGTRLGTGFAADSNASVSAINGGTPDYESIVTRSYTMDAGNGTGTVREFVFGPDGFNGWSDPYTECTIRVVLDTPIVKGAADVLTIEHRFTSYPEVADVTGVIDISGVNYNYIFRGIDIDAHVARPIRCNWHDWQFEAYSSDSLTVNTGTGPSGSRLNYRYAGCSNTYSPGGTPYVQGNVVAGVDAWLGDVRCMTVFNMGMFSSYQVRIGKVSDDTALTKLNTHELRLFYRMYPSRYVP